ncbi:hypothetical protein, partial [Ilumatobacter sp.]|uniref:hypothetical protein n=1 Tax=Ilumatobacter sp. TaxID=1967498 RepID=UPI003C3C2074
MTTTSDDTTSTIPSSEFVPPGPGQWMLDTTHHGRRPTTRFMRPITDRASDGFETLTARFGLPLETMEFATVHGYTYARPKAIGDNGKGGAPPPTAIMWLVARLHPELRRRNRTAREAWAERRWRADVDAWFERGGRDGVLSENLRLQSFDPAAAGDDALATHIEEVSAYLAEQFVLGFETHGGDIVPCGDYLAHCARWGITADDATSLLSGSSPLTVETRDLLAPAARSHASTSDTNTAPGSIAELRSRSPEAATAIDRWLELHGWRLLNSDDVDCPTLHEQPDLQWRIVAALDPDVLDPETHALAPDPAVLRARVPADQRALFDELLTEARYGLRLRDDNVGLRLNWPAGIARRALLEIGRRLEQRGALADGAHVIHCDGPELAALLRGERGPSIDQIRERDAERTFQLSLDPPTWLGDEEPPPPLDAFPKPMARATRAVMAMIDAMQGESSPSDGRLVGHGIGDTAYRGRAVVIAGPDDDFDAIEDGDVLIAPFTSPSFNSVFPLLGAV